MQELRKALILRPMSWGSMQHRAVTGGGVLHPSAHLDVDQHL